MSVEEAAWLAGFLDGEGCFGCWDRKNHRRSCSLKIDNAHRGSLEQCQRITSAGSILSKGVRAGNQEQFIWSVSAQRDMIAILRQLMPYLTVKRDRAETLLSEWKDIDGS